MLKSDFVILLERILFTHVKQINKNTSELNLLVNMKQNHIITISKNKTECHDYIGPKLATT